MAHRQKMLHTPGIEYSNDANIFPDGVLLLFKNLRCQDYRPNWQSQQSLTHYIKTRVTIFLHCCWWCNPWCHAYVKPFTA